jgi:hypothetical protein
LKTNDAAQRRKAIAVLGAIGPSARSVAYAPLLEALRDTDNDVSRDAGAALLKMGAPGKEHIPALTKLLDSPRDPVRLYAVAGLGEFGPDASAALPRVLALYTKEKPEDRTTVLRAAARLGPRQPEVLDLCTKALREGDVARSKVAVEALAAAGPDAALPGLLLALDNADATVRETAEKALRQGPLGKERIKELTDALDGKKEPIRLLLLDVVVKFGADAPETVAALTRLLKGPDGPVRKRSLALVAEMGPRAREAGPAVLGLMKDADAATRLELIDVLQKIGAPELVQSVSYLVAGLKIEMPMDEEQQAQRKKIQDLLVKIGKPAVPALRRALESDFRGGGATNGFARLTVCQTLEAIGSDAGDIETLRVLARIAGQDPFPEVKAAADKARRRVQEK